MTSCSIRKLSRNHHGRGGTGNPSVLGISDRPLRLELKKPLRYPFLAVSTLKARLCNCQTEVQINSELAPSVYLCVLSLAGDRHQGLNFKACGEPVGYLVKMRRLPAAWNLEAL